MTKRDTPIPEFSQHFSPRDIAKYFHGVGHSVGSKYKTYGDIWGAPDELRKIGLLHLILEELEKLNREPEGWIKLHREWLLYWQPIIDSLLKKRDFHINRINKMIGVAINSNDMRHDYYWTSLPYLAEVFRRNQSRHEMWLKYLRSQAKRLVSVKKPEDIIKLEGIGKVRAAKILEQRNLKDKSKKKGESDE